jgi:hypothetical protein
VPGPTGCLGDGSGWGPPARGGGGGGGPGAGSPPKDAIKGTSDRLQRARETQDEGTTAHSLSMLTSSSFVATSARLKLNTEINVTSAYALQRLLDHHRSGAAEWHRGYRPLGPFPLWRGLSIPAGPRWWLPTPSSRQCWRLVHPPTFPPSLPPSSRSDRPRARS